MSLSNNAFGSHYLPLISQIMQCFTRKRMTAHEKVQENFFSFSDRSIIIDMITPGSMQIPQIKCFGIEQNDEKLENIPLYDPHCQYIL